MIELNSLNSTDVPPKVGDTIIINRKQDKRDKFILCKVRDVVGLDHPEIILSSKNDYFIWDMYRKGESWVWRVWNIGRVDLTAITNTNTPFPR